MIPLASTSFMGTFLTIFMIVTLVKAPTLNNVAACVVGGFLFAYVCKITVTIGTFSPNALLNVRALSLRAIVFCVAVAALIAAALYALWARQGYP